MYLSLAGKPDRSMHPQGRENGQWGGNAVSQAPPMGHLGLETLSFQRSEIKQWKQTFYRDSRSSKATTLNIIFVNQRQQRPLVNCDSDTFLNGLHSAFTNWKPTVLEINTTGLVGSFWGAAGEVQQIGSKFLPWRVGVWGGILSTVPKPSDFR